MVGMSIEETHLCGEAPWQATVAGIQPRDVAIPRGANEAEARVQRGRDALVRLLPDQTRFVREVRREHCWRIAAVVDDENVELRAVLRQRAKRFLKASLIVEHRDQDSEPRPFPAPGLTARDIAAVGNIDHRSVL
jgi:hypothetical protein